MFDDGAEMFLAEGDCFIYKRNTNYKFVSETEFEAVIVNFHFSDFIDGRYRIFPKWAISPFLDLLDELREPIKADTPYAQKMRDSILEIEKEILQRQEEKENVLIEAVIKSYLLLTVSLAFAYFHEDITCEPRIDNMYQKEIEQSIQYINEHLSEKLTLDELAKVAFMGKTNYSLNFKKIKGMTVWEYILQERIELAASYLLEDEKELNITELAFLCGFNNLAHFNKMFRALKGMPPSRFRKEHKNPCFEKFKK